MFSRCYSARNGVFFEVPLRSQLIHGSATWNSSVNRDQIRDGVKIMDRLVPTIIYLMMAHPKQLWGDALYPVVSSD